MVRADGMLHNLHKAMLILSNKKTGTLGAGSLSTKNIIVTVCLPYW